MTDPAPRAKRARTIRTATADRPGSTTGPRRQANAPAAQEPASAPPIAAGIPDAPPDRSAATLLRRLPVYQQIAEDLRARITSGEFPPGSPLPSETVMIGHYGASRITVRHAVAALRTAGLVDTAHGRATTVRAVPGHGEAAPFDTCVTRTGGTWTTWDSHGWDEAEPPARYRTQAGPDAAALTLNQGEPVLVCERLLRHPGGATAAHRLVIPFATAANVPALEADPFPRPGQLYAVLAAAGHVLTFEDTLRATMPTPDDVASLAIPDGVPLITHTRTTLDTDDRPLALEQTRLPADRVTITGRINPVTRKRSAAR
jgi:GntR family transcriptional regulator